MSAVRWAIRLTAGFNFAWFFGSELDAVGRAEGILLGRPWAVHLFVVWLAASALALIALLILEGAQTFRQGRARGSQIAWGRHYGGFLIDLSMVVGWMWALLEIVRGTVAWL